MTQHATARGMWTFGIIWFGQMISLIGSGLTDFALGVWVYQRTGSVAQFALIGLSALLPGIVILPFAGALVDRWDRRWMMILSDMGAGLGTLFVALLFIAGRLEVWHIYLAVAVNTTFNGIHWMAYSAATTLLVPKEHYGRASGMVQAAESAAYIVSPMLAGVLLITIQIQGVILIDFATFLFAVVTLLLVRTPRFEKSDQGEARGGSLLRAATYGWIYITAQPGLLSLLVFMAVFNFTWGIVEVSLTPMVLSFASAAVLGVIWSVGGIGTLLGGIVMGAWGGPKRRMYGILGFMLLEGIAWLFIGLRPNAPLIAAAYFFLCVMWPIIGGCNQAIWQSKVAPDVQGRVFAMRRVIASSLSPLAYITAGLLADKVLKSLVDVGGPLAGSIGQIIGVGPGRGIGLLVIVMGIVIVSMTVGAYLYPRLRLLEEESSDQVPEGD